MTRGDGAARRPGDVLQFENLGGPVLPDAAASAWAQRALDVPREQWAVYHLPARPEGRGKR